MGKTVKHFNLIILLPQKYLQKNSFQWCFEPLSVLHTEPREPLG